MSNNTWSYFDKIICINLYNRDDRYHDVKQLFVDHNIPAQFYRTHKHPNGGKQGCFESHINCIKKAYDEGCKNILIFEDDIEATKYCTEELLEEAINFMEDDMRKERWDVFYLGPMHDSRLFSTYKVYSHPSVYKIRSQCTHAYVLNRSSMRELKDLKFEGISIDYYYRDYLKSYSIYPSMFVQGASESDIGGQWFGGVENIGGIKQKFSRCNEFYAYHVGIPWAHWIIVLFIIWFICFVLWPRAWWLHMFFFILLVILILIVYK